MSDANEKLHVYTGDQLDVTWDGRLCIHVGECGRSTGDLFKGGRDPWCQPNVTSAEDATDVVQRCPSGALTYLRKDGGAPESPAPSNRVMVANNGPYYVTGDLQVDGAAADMPGVRFRAALCRCGQSKNKPFCDNSHESANFVDRGSVGDKGTPVSSTGSLEIKRAPNGPLLLSGNVSIYAASGRLAWQGSKCALCRCGESKNKPFCDGGHKAAGFSAE